ncbi:MAG: hypothetical protein AAF985_00925 [Bacteroidota bacterium]
MNNYVSNYRLFLGALFLVFGMTNLNGQAWNGASTFGNASRSGKTGIGYFDPSGPQANLHLRPLSLELSLFRLQGYSSTFSSNIWDTNVLPDGSYNLGYTSSPTGSLNNRLTLTSIGRLGINNMKPKHNLHVNGDGKFNTNLYVSGRMGVGTDSPSQLLTVSSPSDPIIRLERSEGKNHDWEIYSKSGGGLYFRGGSDGNGASGGPGWGDKMAITSSGRVGIGTDGLPPLINNSKGDPFNLYVTGGVLTDEVKVKVGWSDYVFEADYYLLPLEEVEQHIESNGYLHNTPSGETIEKEGLDLGALTSNQQEKIEELFLHVIELNKRVKTLEEENKTLREQNK